LAAPPNGSKQLAPNWCPVPLRNQLGILLSSGETAVPVEGKRYPGLGR
jgi:hypothetical protein